MEEKERYEWNSRFDEAIKDNQTGDIVNAVEVLNQQDERINELEDLVIEYKNKLYRRLDQVDNLIKENQQLKQQLAEKEKKIEDVEDVSRRLIRTCGKTNCYGKNQTAIRELEKVKKFLLEKIAEKQSCFDSGNYNDFADGVKTICELMLISIDNQIKSLKGEK